MKLIGGKKLLFFIDYLCRLVDRVRIYLRVYRTLKIMYKKLLTSKAEILLINQSFVRINIFDNAELEPEDIQAIHEAKLLLTEGRLHVVMFVHGKYSSCSVEAREIAADGIFFQGQLAKAVIFNSLAQRLLFHFFIKTNKLSGKIKLFEDENSANKWLEKIIKN
jgi:hypothetical protein